ncbi:MAG: LuxR C-terminal-related transcriptional regulator [Adlercreutzia sp.]
MLLICDFVGERNRAALTIAPSTVKVYAHRLLQKTECENRQALIQDFWKSA